ncbi:MAG TPA: hypothetical protein VJY34_08845 [Roseiarcus sp.]|nr:hypothetical protein [Roseiarcus sp.]
MAEAPFVDDRGATGRALLALGLREAQHANDGGCDRVLAGDVENLSRLGGRAISGRLKR